MFFFGDCGGLLRIGLGFLGGGVFETDGSVSGNGGKNKGKADGGDEDGFVGFVHGFLLASDFGLIPGSAGCGGTDLTLGEVGIEVRDGVSRLALIGFGVAIGKGRGGV